MSTPDDEASEVTWFSDDPDARLATTLGRADFLQRVWELIDEARVHSSSTVFALVGAWGSGKTSMLDWLRDRATDASDGTPWSVIQFNPWDYPDSESLQLGFFASLRRSFGEDKWGKASKRIRNFGVAVAPVTSVAAAFGVFDPSKPLEGAAKLLDNGGSAEAARAKLVKKLETTRRPVLIVLDDIDRISADELLITLKLIRQLGRLPYVHYLLSYDEATILNVLTQTNLIGGSDTRRARDYMEKVVQVRFDVPSLRPDDATALVNQALDNLGKETDLRLTPEAMTRFSDAYFRFMAPRLNTPRALRRYFAQVRLLAPRFKDEVDFADFLTLTWIRTFEPGVYSLLQRRRESLLGDYDPPATNEPKVRQEVAARSREKWDRRFEEAGTRENDRPGVHRAVASLFHKFADATGLQSAFRSSAPPRINNEEYFDRYFSAGIPEGDIADATVRRAVSDTEAGVPLSGPVARCKLSLIQDHRHTATKLLRAAAEAEISSPAMFRWLTEIYLSQERLGSLLSPMRQVEEVVSQRLRRLKAVDILPALAGMQEKNGGMLLTRAVHAATQPEADEVPVLELTDDHRRIVTASMRTALEAQQLDVTNISGDARYVTWTWSEVDPGGFATWISESASESGELPALGYFVMTTTAVGRAPDTKINGFDTVDAAKHFDLAELRRTYAGEIESADLVEVSNAARLADTPRNRILMTLTALKRYAELEPLTETAT